MKAVLIKFNVCWFYIRQALGQPDVSKPDVIAVVIQFKKHSLIENKYEKKTYQHFFHEDK